MIVLGKIDLDVLKLNPDRKKRREHHTVLYSSFPCWFLQFRKSFSFSQVVLNMKFAIAALLAGSAAAFAPEFKGRASTIVKSAYETEVGAVMPTGKNLGNIDLASQRFLAN